MVQYKSSGLVLDFAHQPNLTEPGATELIDFSRSKTNGTFLGAGNPDWVDTTHGLHIMEFASGDYVQVTCPKLNFTDGDFSAVIRFKTTDLSDTNVLLQRGGGNTGWKFMIIGPTGVIFFRTVQLGVNQVTTSAAATIAQDTSYTVGFSRSGASVWLYRNGADVTDTAGVHIDPATNAQTLKIGIDDDLVNVPFIGQITPFIQVFDFALTLQQHADIHDQWKAWT